jgi:hypothetical protein
MAALRSRGAQFIPSLEGRGFLWQFCKSVNFHTVERAQFSEADSPDFLGDQL